MGLGEGHAIELIPRGLLEDYRRINLVPLIPALVYTSASPVMTRSDPDILSTDRTLDMGDTAYRSNFALIIVNIGILAGLHSAGHDENEATRIAEGARPAL